MSSSEFWTVTCDRVAAEVVASVADNAGLRTWQVELEGGRRQLGLLGHAEVFRRVLPDLGNGEQPLNAWRVEGVNPLGSRRFLEGRTVDVDEERGGIRVRPVRFASGAPVVVVGGPCGVESREQALESARGAVAGGAVAVRGGAYKPRTSPHAFQGLGPEGLDILAEVRRELRVPIVTEVMDPRDVERAASVADVLQVGTRNMANFSLLAELGRTRVPVLLKRGMSATLDELLQAAEHVLSGGNFRVILCERGIRTHEPSYRNVIDLNAIPYLRKRTWMPVVVDPSHGTGRRELVEPLALAAVAAGADGLLVECHRNPAEALSDGPQSLHPEELDRLVRRVRLVAQAIGRAVAEPASNGA